MANFGEMLLSPNRTTVTDAIADDEAHHLEPTKVTTAKLAIDGEVEQGQVAQVACEL